MYVERRPFIQGLVSYDVDEATAKMEATERHIEKRHRIAAWSTAVMIIFGILCAGTFFIGNTLIVINLVDAGIKTWKTALANCGWVTLASIILFIISAIGNKVADTIKEKDDFDFYTIPELFLWTETADVITSFVNYNEKKADLYLQYKKYTEDEDGNMVETTGVYIIEGFKVRRTAMSKETILDLNNGIYYVPYNYVNKRNNN